MQLAYELEESMTIIHFKIPKVNCTEVMLVLMQVSFYCSGSGGFCKDNISNSVPYEMYDCSLLVHCILDLYAEFLDRNTFLS